jgi:hypothetical protein
MITVTSPIRISTKHSVVSISIWSDDAVSFETLSNGKERRYWLTSETNGQIVIHRTNRKVIKKAK